MRFFFYFVTIVGFFLLHEKGTLFS